MIKAFNLKLKSDDLISKMCPSNGINVQTLNPVFKRTINKLLSSSESLDGDLLSDATFELENVDAFISYSHKDADLAKSLAIYLRSTFGFKVFLDCEIWNSSDELLKMIDDKYCLKNDGKMYSYEKRNLSTSHVHSLLTTAILRQLVKSKFVFFLNTINSVPSARDSINESEKTASPWIYEEIVFTNIILECQKGNGSSLRESVTVFDSMPSILRVLPMNNFVNLYWGDLQLLQSKRTKDGNCIKLFQEFKGT